MAMHALLWIATIGCLTSFVSAGIHEKIRLRDVEVLTLHQGRYTNARRSSPVSQLKCVGGSARCSSFVPKVVQCYNRGSDGHDVQWECKTDMDNRYRFGEIAVSCEGYDYPDDPYILQGSCGLEYTIDLTSGASGEYGHETIHLGSFVSGLILLCTLAVIGGVIYMCLCQGKHTHHDAPPPYPGYTNPTAPPPPGFHPEYTTPSFSSGPGYSSSSGWQQPYGVPPTTGNGGGFWSGAMTGGALGYLFGSRGQNQYHRTSPQYQARSSWWSSTPAPDSSSTWSSTTTASESSGTRTASGFGGTKRR